jgi:hypothetical protein
MGKMHAFDHNRKQWPAPGRRRAAGDHADLIKLSMVKVQDVLDAQARKTLMIIQVHDEMVFEVPEDEVEWVRTEIPHIMAGVAELRVPLLAELGVGENWEKALAARGLAAVKAGGFWLSARDWSLRKDEPGRSVLTEPIPGLRWGCNINTRARTGAC